MTIDFDSVDYFTDPALIPDPHPYFDHMRGKCPVSREPHYGVLAVTGYHEAHSVLKDSDTFSSCIALGGPFPPLPFTPEGDDITDQIGETVVFKFADGSAPTVVQDKDKPEALFVLMPMRV